MAPNETTQAISVERGLGRGNHPSGLVILALRTCPQRRPLETQFQ
jgi:hypothetical protein